jgi:hypothetical protein
MMAVACFDKAGNRKESSMLHAERQAEMTKEDPMNHIDDKEAIELLRKAGCTALEIERLRRLRREYAEKERDRPSQDHRRPGFAGWLGTFLQEELRYFSFWGW